MPNSNSKQSKSQNTNEIWNDILGYVGYQASDKGRLKRLEKSRVLKNGKESILKERILKPSKRKQGDLVVKVNGKTVMVHKFIALAFLGESDGRDVRHKNGNKTDNRASNLEYISRNQTLTNAYYKSKDSNRGKKLTRNRVDRIVDDILNGVTGKEIARKHKISESTVSDIKSLRRWGWYTHPRLSGLSNNKKVEVDANANIVYSYDVIEVWRDVPGWSGWKVSSNGGAIRPNGQPVRGLEDKIQQYIDSDIKDILIKIDSKNNKTISLFRLMAMAFYNAPKLGGTVKRIHKHRDWKDVHIANLEFGYGSDVSGRKKDLGGKRKLDGNDVRNIRIRIENKEKLKDIAEDYGVSVGAISQIKNNYTHTDVDDK